MMRFTRLIGRPVPIQAGPIQAGLILAGPILVVPLLAVVILAASALAGPPVAWTVTDGSRVGFTAYQGSTPVNGQFDDFTAEILFDPAAPETARVGVDIVVASVNTHDKGRDDTIRSPGLFDAGRFPTARFEADGFRSLGDNRYEAAGRLRLRDVTRDVVLPFTLEISDHPDDAGRLQAHARGQLSVQRLEYGVGQFDWATTSTVGDTVDIVIDIRATGVK